MNPYQSPIPIEEYRPWFSGVPLWAKRAALIAGFVLLFISCAGFLNIAIMWWRDNLTDPSDFMYRAFGTEIGRLFENLWKG